MIISKISRKKHSRNEIITAAKNYLDTEQSFLSKLKCRYEEMRKNNNTLVDSALSLNQAKSSNK